MIKNVDINTPIRTFNENFMRTFFFLIGLLFCLNYTLSSQSLTVDTFALLNITKKPTFGMVVRAPIFNRIYEAHRDDKKFQPLLFEYLKNTDDERAENYRYIGNFLSTDKSYSDFQDLNLSEKIFKRGLKDLTNRIKAKQKLDEDAYFLESIKCELIFEMGIFYFMTDRPKKGVKFFEIGYYKEEGEQQPRCSGAMPARTEEEFEFIFSQFEKYRKKKK